uniref:Trehalase n=1 Tax=Meloidogyne enterolobii TaxID=390850 RepID=A0A6V7W1S9_MELEN|nr:unnamed protein product [Meloidogyne enterolobii]
MHIQPINLRKKHWLLFYIILGFIFILIFIFSLINFLKWRNGKEFVIFTSKSEINQVYINYLGNNDNEFTLQFVSIEEKQFSIKETNNYQQPSPGFITNCSEPICEGPLAPIYCSGPLISSAWYFGVQHQCPGTKLLFEPNEILKNFRKIIRGKVIKKGDFMQFCEENFANTDYIKPSNLTDWQPNPKNFELINDPKWRKFAVALHQIWPLLTREFIDDVHKNQHFYPVISVPNRFLVPGGFFKVFFYWDTYWILKGLYFSNLIETSYGVLKNFAHLLNYHGFIPNSGNIQLSRRSQPPFFTQMIKDYFDITKNKSFLQEFLPLAEKELKWWNQNRSIIFEFKEKNYLMFQYKPLFFWSSTASACESGIDFSSRWYNWKNNTENGGGGGGEVK